MKDVLADRRVVLSGCSGGGKSTLLAELAKRGFLTVPEPGRRIVEAELRADGAALPWRNLTAFAQRAIDVAQDDLRRNSAVTRWIFFDRGLIDAVSALQYSRGAECSDDVQLDRLYRREVFMTPPWPEIFTTDSARPHGFAEAVAEYERLLQAYGARGYQTLSLPKVSVAERADFLLDRLGIARTATGLSKPP